jgi:hypothetical protein
MILLDSAEHRCGNRAAVSPAPQGAKRMGSPIRCKADSRRASPATRADRAQKIAGAAGRGARRAGGRDHRRRAPRDYQARGGRHSAGQQIDRCGTARDQDADRHAEGRREKGRCGAALRARPFTAADDEVVVTFITWLRQSWEEELRERGTENPGSLPER